MMPTPSSAWQAQSPSADFADRALAAVLRDRSHTPIRRHPRRWAPLALAACVLMAGVAWGWSVRVHAPRIEPRQAELTAPATTSAPFGEVAAPRLSPLQSPRVTNRPVAAPAASGAPRVKATPPSPAPPLPAPPMMIPRCSCNELACDCGPEP
jgi:hypothetical protein